METAISTGLLARIVALAAADPAREVCGLLLGRPGLIEAILPAANVDPAPARRFELDPAVHFAALRAARAGGPAILGHYHSHPGGRAIPSATDAALAFEPGLLWMIVAGAAARLWLVSGSGTFIAAALRVTDRGGCASPVQPPQGPAGRHGPAAEEQG